MPTPIHPYPYTVCTQCRAALHINEFPTQTAGGKRYRRKVCTECMREYYRRYSRERRNKVASEHQREALG